MADLSWGIITLTERGRRAIFILKEVTMAATVDLTNPIFTDPDAARAHFEAIRWPNGAHCPFCGQFDTVKPLGGKSMGPGWYHCKDCRRKFTVRVGTLYERSHIPLHKWLLATHLLSSSKKGMSAHQLHRMLSITYKSAWFMAHRIREGMRDDTPAEPIGGGSPRPAGPQRLPQEHAAYR
jgi:transposase-like protein